MLQLTSSPKGGQHILWRPRMQSICRKCLIYSSYIHLPNNIQLININIHPPHIHRNFSASGSVLYGSKTSAVAHWRASVGRSVTVSRRVFLRVSLPCLWLSHAGVLSGAARCMSCPVRRGTRYGKLQLPGPVTARRQDGRPGDQTVTAADATRRAGVAQSKATDSVMGASCNDPGTLVVGKYLG